MINMDKIKEKPRHRQVAGLRLEDPNIEFIGVHETQEVLWMQHGRTLEWKHLPLWAYNLCEKKYLHDAKAHEDLSRSQNTLSRQVEIYIYHVYGGVDDVADILNGVLTPSENYRHCKNDISIHWNTKWITINDIALTLRDIKIIDMIKEDLPDKAIASELGIHQATLDFHKRNLCEKVGATSKTDLLIKALNEQI